MTSRERIKKALSHQLPDRVPIDLGSTSVTGINLKSYLALRKTLGLPVDQPPMVYDPMQMLVEVEEDVLRRFHCDAVPLVSPFNAFGADNRNTSIWTVQSGITCRTARDQNIWKSEEGQWVYSPESENTGIIRAVMPSGQMFFDIIPNQGASISSGRKDFANRFPLFSDETLNELESSSRRLYESTEYAIIGNVNIFPLGGFIALLAPQLAYPQGICTFDQWLEALITDQDYIHEVFSLQYETAIKNAEMLHQAVGERIEAIFVSGTDFGTQQSTLFSPEIFQHLYKPYYSSFNSWIHSNTSWKTFFHSCGAVVNLLKDFVEMGVDIINPVQFTAQGMDLQKLKNHFGEDLVFWGGGVDTQKTLPEGPEHSIHEEVQRNCSILSKQGGFVFSPVHNIQADVKPSHIISAYDAVL